MPDFNSQNIKNLRLTISLVVLVCMATGLFIVVRQPSQQLVDPDLFRVADQEKVDMVLLQKGQQKVELKFDGSRWRVNQKYEADNQMINVLFATLDQARPKRPVAANQQDSISLWLTDKGVEVNLFIGDDLVKKFRAGGNERKTESWFMDDGPPYVMTIPGYRAYVSFVLEMGEEAWRDKRIFNFNWRNFKSLNASVEADHTQNFEVTFADKFFTIPGLARVDTTRLNDYLDAVSLLSADQIITTSLTPTYDSLFQTAPSFQIKVKDISEQEYMLQVWPPLKNDTKVLGRWGAEDVVLFNRAQVIPIARKKSYFSGS